MKRKQCTFASLLLLMVVAAIACGNNGYCLHRVNR